MTDIPFQKLIVRFFEGVRLEAEISEIPVPEGSHLIEVLTAIYFERHQKLNPGPLILGCAQILGQITFAMYRSELKSDVGNPHMPHTPIEPQTTPPTRLEERHLRLARELYGFYTNGLLRRKVANPIAAPIDDVGREIDQPCPLCP
jgi:hypothetical protein